MRQPPSLSVVEGCIDALRIAPGKVNLVEDIQQGALFTGVAAGLSGQAGILANSASLALYDGEDVEHLACLINGQLAVGTFEWLNDLKVNDEVKLVVSRIEDGPLFIHGILRKCDQLLWLPYSVSHTRRGWVMHAVKLCSVLFVGGWIFVGGVMLFTGKGLATNEILMHLGISISVVGLVGVLTTKGVMGLGQQAEDIFRAYGVPRFERFRIKPFSILNLHFSDDPDSLKKKYIFKFADALAAHKKKFGLA